MNKTQLVVVSACVALGVSIFVFGKKTVLTQDTLSPEAVVANSGMDETAVLDIAQSGLKPEEADKLKPILAALDTIEQPAQKAGMLRSIAAFWDTKGQYAAAAIYHLQAADLLKEAPLYMLAGSRFQAAAEMANDTLLRNFMFRKAVVAMENASSISPDDLDIKADLANVFVLSSPQPMQGIQRLLDIVMQEPKHLRANVHLARLAITSGQNDKAIERYQNLINWYPAYADAYLGLGEAYYNTGQLEPAIRNLEQYKGLVRDEQIIAQVDEFIAKIKSSTP
jgi:tetratricopeptide (TPR) repeat protein